MNDKTPTIPLNITEALKTLDALTAMLKALANRDGQNKPITVTEPASRTARFGSASADASRALQQLSATIDNLMRHERMNQKILNLIQSIKADAERFSKNLESTVIDVAGIIREFNPVATEMTPSATTTPGADNGEQQ